MDELHALKRQEALRRAEYEARHAETLRRAELQAWHTDVHPHHGQISRSPNTSPNLASICPGKSLSVADDGRFLGVLVNPVMVLIIVVGTGYRPTYARVVSDSWGSLSVSGSDSEPSSSLASCGFKAAVGVSGMSTAKSMLSCLVDHMGNEIETDLG